MIKGLFTLVGGNETIVRFPSEEMLRFLTLQTASCVIKECQEYSFDLKTTNGIGLILSEKLKWKADNLIDGILAQVEFLYAIAKREIEAAESEKMGIMKFDTDYQILADALIAFQKLQNEYSAKIGIKGGVPISISTPDPSGSPPR